jgi:hypothetical protein
VRSQANHDPLMRDAKARWRIICISIIAATVGGLWGESAGLSSVHAQLLCAIVALTSFVFQVELYSPEWKKKRPDRRTARAIKPSRLKPKDMIRGLVPLATGIALVLIIVEVSSGVQAAILNFRLGSVADAASRRSTVHPAKVKNILELASQSHTSLHPQIVLRATSALSNSTVPANWDAYMALVTYQYRMHDYRFAKPSTYSPESPPVTPFRIDNMFLDDMVLSYVKVTYDGGPVTVKHTAFPYSSFSIRDSEQGREFARALLSSTDGYVSVSIR